MPYAAVDLVLPVSDLRIGDTILDHGDALRLYSPMQPDPTHPNLSLWRAFDASGDLVLGVALESDGRRRVIGRDGDA